MVYPVILAGEKAGRLTVETEGLFTVFEAELPGREGIMRLSVYGGGRETYLGVMQQWQGGLYLRKKLSRAALRDFPKTIDYAGESGESNKDRVGVVNNPEDAGAETEKTLKKAVTVTQVHETAEKNAEKVTVDNGGLEKSNGTAEQKSQDEELLWFSAPSGVLSAFDGRRSLVAIPADMKNKPAGAKLRKIGEREYLVFIK